MKRNLLSLALALVLCLSLAAVPASAASPYTDDWGNRFSDVLDKEEKTFTGYSGRKASSTIYYLAPDASVYLGKRAARVGYLDLNGDTVTSRDKTSNVITTEKTYTRDQFEKEFGFYDLYCLISEPDSKTTEYLYFLFDDSAANNALDYVLQSGGTVLEKYRGAGGKMVIPDGVVQIKGMFMDASTAASVTSLTLPSSVRNIDGWSFTNCEGLSSLELPRGLRSLGDCAFSGCSSLSSVTVPASVTDIGTGVFSDCGLSRVVLESGLTTIGNSMFSNCDKLIVLTVPASVTQVGSRAFSGCTRLNSITFENGNTQIEADAFPQSIPGLLVQAGQLTVNAPAGGAVEAYCTAHNIPFRATGTVPGGTTTNPTNPGVTVEDIPASGTAYASTQSVTVDGKAVEFQMYALKDANGNLTNYIKLRDMAYVLNGSKAQFSVGYDGAISLATGQPYEAGGTEMTTPYSGDRAYQGGAQTVKINQANVAMTAITLTDDNGGGYNYFRLRDLGKALGFYVGYSNESGIYIDSTKPYAE